ncbi:TetR/AcrR family transcriptional regulator, partial [Staphylococcus capitis]|nr:TetR/AcrR family transcriptional regulator [Staphylococcus capitis]
MAASPGLWGGRTAAQRRAERRERLVGAAQEIWIEQGWAAVTMRGVCARTS